MRFPHLEQYRAIGGICCPQASHDLPAGGGGAAKLLKNPAKITASTTTTIKMKNHGVSMNTALHPPG